MTAPRPAIKYRSFTPDVYAYNSGAEYPFHEYDSELTIPSGKNPNQNARLTIHLWVRFDYVDRHHRVGNILVREDGEYRARDADGDTYPILDWTAKSRSQFELDFLEAEKHWNHKFLLITPRDYDWFDYQSDDLNWLVRPNVLCRLRLHINRPRVNTVIRVVRLDRTETFGTFMGFVRSASQFRSHSMLYTDSDVRDSTVYHELGHALGQSHIRGLESIYSKGRRGDRSCVLTRTQAGNEDDCYRDSNGSGVNTMGSGKRLSLLNAISWQKRIPVHCEGTRWLDWKATMNTKTPPRKIPLAVTLVGKTPQF